MRKLVCLVLILVVVFSTISVSAGRVVYPDGKINETVVFHNGSGWYVRNGKWIQNPSYVCEFGEDGKVYVPLQYLESALGYKDAYCQPDGKTVVAIADNLNITQLIGVKKVTVNDKVFDDAAPYVAKSGAVMVALDTYSYPLGFTLSVDYPESYKDGKATIKRSVKVNHSRVEVNKAMQMVTVYGKGPGGKEYPVWYGVCSTGMPGQETVEGRFFLRPLSMGSYYGKWYLFVNSGIWIVNCTQISGDYCFHSILFTRLFNPASLNYQSYYDLGKKATNGCVRMTAGDSAYIYDNCGGLPCDIGPGYYSDELAKIKKELMDELPDTAEEYIKAIS